jgi:hypothetical protein
LAYDSARHDERPEGCHWVCLDSLQHCHVVFHILGLDGIGLVLGSLSLFVVNCIMLDLLSMVVLLLEVLVHGVWWMADYVGSGAKVEWSNRQMRLERTREVMPVPSLWTGDSAGRETIDASYEKQSSARLTPVFDHLYPGPDLPPLPRRCAPGVWSKRGRWGHHLAGPFDTQVSFALSYTPVHSFLPRLDSCSLPQLKRSPLKLGQGWPRTMEQATKA